LRIGPGAAFLPEAPDIRSHAHDGDAMTATPSPSPLRNATIIGTALQLAMVISGHWVEFIKLNVFAVGGMAISLIAGTIYASQAGVSRGASAKGGAIAGGLCALIGVGVSYFLGDVPASVFAIGTISSTATGAIGGAIMGGRK
jgi:hypothetical protein